MIFAQLFNCIVHKIALQILDSNARYAPMNEDDEQFILNEQLTGNVVGGLFLILSNLFLAPAVYYSLDLHEEASAIVYFNLIVVSSLYHSCRAGFSCVVSYVDHRKLDYLFVYFAVLWTLTTGLGRSHAISMRVRMLVFCVFFLPTAILIVGDQKGIAVQIVGGLLPAAVMIALAHNKGVRLFRRLPWAVLAIVLGAISGVFMYAMPLNTYEWSHSVWHVLSMLAVACLIYSTKRHYREQNPLDDPEKYRR